MAAGKIITGFSKPYVAVLTEGGAPYYLSTYNYGQKLARGVSVSIDPETSDDNGFYADNGRGESEPVRFTSGTLNLTVDGLLDEAEALIMGVTKENGWLTYGDSQKAPYVGVAFIIRYQSAGAVTFVPVLLRKCQFSQISTAAATQEENVDYQTQELSAKIMKMHSGEWKRVGPDFETEALAESAIRTWFSILEDD